MAKMTAIEWFWIHLPEKISKEYFDLFEQAKAIEKEQIMESWKHGNLPTFLGRVLTAEHYYNETYNK